MLPKRPEPRRRHPDLEARVRAACSKIHGLTPAQFEQHIAGIVKVVEQARAGRRPRRSRRSQRQLVA